MGGKLWGLIPFLLLIAGLAVMFAKNVDTHWAVPHAVSTGLAGACLILAVVGLCLYVAGWQHDRPRPERSGAHAQHRA